jgi:CrcB protein
MMPFPALFALMFPECRMGAARKGWRTRFGDATLICRFGCFAGGERRIALQRYLLIGLGGALGSMARYWVGSTIGGRIGVRFPYGTLVVNISACLVIGFTLTWLSERAEISPAWRYLVAVGFIGAYSTFSTYEWETLSTLRTGAFALASLYAVGSLILGLAATWCGAVLAEAL